HTPHVSEATVHYAATKVNGARRGWAFGPNRGTIRN
ncbi:uncharacterized protein METZ01_LOCUS192650, partial [marine metagenome]